MEAYMQGWIEKNHKNQDWVHKYYGNVYGGGGNWIEFIPLFGTPY